MVNYFERAISNMFTMIARTHEKGEILLEDYFNGRKLV